MLGMQNTFALKVDDRGTTQKQLFLFISNSIQLTEKE